MGFWIVVGIIFVISFLWALVSLFKDSKKPKAVRHAEKELRREKILYKA